MLATKLAATLIIVALAGWRGTESIKQDACSPIPDTFCKGKKCSAECPVGCKKSVKLNSCEPCSAGSFKNSTGDLDCLACPGGTFASKAGSTACSLCDSGTFSSSGAVSCKQCPPGTYSSGPGSSECIKCAAGTYSSSSGSNSCSKCAPGTYSNKDGAKGCEKCDFQFALRRHSGMTHCDLCPNKTSALGPNKCYPVERLGCFKDKATRDLPDTQQSKGNTPQLCVGHCKSKGYAYAGVQASAWCFCGNSYGQHGKLQDSECSMKCNGDSKQTCGNNWKNEVYSTGLNPVQRLGCFKDNAIRYLPNRQVSNKNTPQLCVEQCKSKGYAYAGVQASAWCFCGNSYGWHGKVQDSECSMKCKGDSKQTCGNHWKNEVYSTGLNPVRRLGCFKDKATRDLPDMQQSKGNTPQLCIEHCKSKGFAYAGVQASAWCFCGNSYGWHGKLQDSECSMKCNGDSKQTCGNQWKNEVYSTGL